MRSGNRCLAPLKDNRCVYLHGERVADVASHLAFQGICKMVASLRDYACDLENEMQFADPGTGVTANKVYLIPRSQENLAWRR